MIGKIQALYYRLPWTPRLLASVDSVSHRLQVNSYTVTIDVLSPTGSRLAMNLNGIDLPFNHLENETSSFTPNEGEQTSVVATTFIPDSPDNRFRLEVTPEGSERPIEVLNIPSKELKPDKIQQPYIYDLDGILESEELETRIISGWCFALNPLRVSRIQARLDEQPLTVEYHLERKDTQISYPDQIDAEQCGFECELPDGINDGNLTLECQLQEGSWTEFFQAPLPSIRRITHKPDPEKPARVVENQSKAIYQIDNLFVEQQRKLRTKIRGWIFLKDGPSISDVRLLFRGKEWLCRYGLHREDVHAEYPGQPNALNSGFEIQFDDLPGNPTLTFQLKTDGSGWLDFDTRKVAQIPITYYTDKKIAESKSGVRSNVENAQIGKRYGHQFMMTGWCFRTDGQAVEEVRIRTGKQTFSGKSGIPREDVFAENKDNYANSLNSGFEIPMDDIPRTAKLRFEYKTPRGRWRLFAEENFSRFPVSHFATESKEKKDYGEWLKAHAELLNMGPERAGELLDTLSCQPKISIIMPVYNTPEIYLRSAIQSVIDQYYANWELCIADDASTKPHVTRVLDEFAASDKRIRVTRREENGHICKASNSALDLATGEWCAFLDHDDTYPKDALLRTVDYMNRYPEAGLFYSDEDKLDADENRHAPYFKPDWNPELLEGQNFICHLTVTRTELVKKVGGFQPGLEGSQDWDLFLKITEQLETSQVIHIPYVLYHWRAIEGSTALALEEKGYIRESSFKTLQGHCQRTKPGVEIIPVAHGHWRLKYAIPEPAPLVSIIIPNKNQASILRACIDSIRNQTTYPNYEIMVVDNQSTEQDAIELFEELRKKEVRILSYDKPFNFSAINNFAASQAKGEFLTFLNNDITIINGDWLNEMVSHACKKHVGAVGAKLYYPEDCIQHAGVILGINGVAGHCFKYAARGEPGQQNRLNLVQQFSAVTAACLVIEKTIFDEVGGFEEEHLGVAFNDIDLCLRIKEAGYANIWTPHAQLYHHESLSRGDDNSETRKTRVDNEIEYMRKRWGDLLRHDPTYNPNLTLEFEDFSLAWPPRLPRP